MAGHRTVAALRCGYLMPNSRRGPCRNPKEEGQPHCGHHLRYIELQRDIWTAPNERPDVSVVDAMEEEVQRSAGMVRALELEVYAVGIHELLRDQETRETREGGPGGGYTMRTLSAGEAQLMKSYRTERQHLLKVLDVVARAGFRAEELRLVQRISEGAVAMAFQIATELGHDPTDQVVQDVITAALAGINGERDAVQRKRDAIEGTYTSDLTRADTR